MPQSELKARIKTKGEELGIDLIGFSQAKPLERMRHYLQRRAQAGRQTTLEHDNIEQRIDPELILPGSKTVITAGLAYGQGEPDYDRILRGSISCSAWGRDYHRVLAFKLEQLADFIREASGSARLKCFVDTGPPVDRALAVEAGLGWSGKNCALINPQFGSWVFLGQLYTDLVLEPDLPLEQGCGECDSCLRACPTGALLEAHVLDPFRCLSYLTQMKGFVPLEFRKLMGKRIYGCDTCQAVCPVNKSAAKGKTEDFKFNLGQSRPGLLELLSLTNREFKQIFADSAAAWRGRTVLQRNALIALGNSRQKEAVEPVSDCLKDPRPVIRGHAAWALSELSGFAVLPQMEEALRRETDEMAAKELFNALVKLRK